MANGLNRREFLLLRTDRTRQTAVLSCERLYMRFVDAELADSAAELFGALARDLGTVRSVRLTDTSWLASDDLARRLDAVLAAFSAGGGRVLKGIP